MTIKKKADTILKRGENRERFWRLLVKLVSVAEIMEKRLIIENPWANQTFLRNNFILPPTFVDNDRTLRGDYFAKPTAYWFINCKPTYGRSIQKNKKRHKVYNCKRGQKPGICSEERSMISPDYARNFIHDFILGKPQKYTELSLFD